MLTGRQTERQTDTLITILRFVTRRAVITPTTTGFPAASRIAKAALRIPRDVLVLAICGPLLHVYATILTMFLFWAVFLKHFSSQSTNVYNALEALARVRYTNRHFTVHYIYTASSVVCVSGTRVSCAKTAEPIECLPGYRLIVGQKTVRWTGLGRPGEKEHCRRRTHAG